MKEFKEYLKAVNKALSTGKATEHTHRAALAELFEASDPKSPRITALNEPKRAECGAPDFVIIRKFKNTPFAIGYAEAKDVNANLDEIAKSEQLKRYRSSLDNLVLTNYLEFRHYVDGILLSRSTLASLGVGNKARFTKDGISETETLLHDFLIRSPKPVESPRELAERMARLTKMIRDVAIETLKAKKPSLLNDLRDAMAKSLIPNINKDSEIPQFADLFAQTLAYGLFAARVSQLDTGKLKRDDAARQIPRTNPLLRKLFDRITGVELEDEPYVRFVDELTNLLSHTRMGEVLKDFGLRTKQEDPVVHFYETFLAAYDPTVRELRGVYYTPEPVVSYIVRSVNRLLKDKFGCPEGLRDTSTVKYEKTVHSGSKETKLTAVEHKVLILDPACGTGTFLYSVVDLIRNQFRKENNAGAWKSYISSHLLPRLYGFELLMAPYSVAHFKLGMQLMGMDIEELFRENWAYDFSADERLNVYLTNTLDNPNKPAELPFGFREISEEANAANRVKRELPILVIMGNPPYSGQSANKGKWMKELVRDTYYPKDEIKEQNPKLLLDDYVKFIRFAQWKIEKQGSGILAFITNHGYLDNPTFRRMRESLMNSFDEIYVLDLHGNLKKKEKAPNGRKDRNVFDIQQGVAIGIFVKLPKGKAKPTIKHHELWGKRNTPDGTGKYDWLRSHDIKNTKWKKLKPRKPFNLFVPFDYSMEQEYSQAAKVTDIFRIHSSGIKSHRDHFAIAFERGAIEKRISDFIDSKFTDAQIREKYGLKDNNEWKLSEKRESIGEKKNLDDFIKPILYRPFDVRFTYYHTDIHDRPRPEVMNHMLAGQNLGLIMSRQMDKSGTLPVSLSSFIIDGHCITLAVSYSYLLPLYLYHKAANGETMRSVNLSKAFVTDVEKKVRLRFDPDIDNGFGNLRSTLGPRDIFNYIYAIFHSPTYRERYAGFLKIDFPRVPLTSDRKLFVRLAKLGARLVSLHLLEAPELSQDSKFETSYPEKGSDIVDKGFPKYYAPGKPGPDVDSPLVLGRVYINKGDAIQGKAGQYFYGVPPEVWEFKIGGYQVCEKWLKDRRGRELSYDDLKHYKKIVTVIMETMKLMNEIDRAIPGWPIE